MKMTPLLVVLTSFALANSVLVPVQVSAHHAFAAEFDINLPIEFTGTVTEIQWTNPHGRVLIDIEDENGDVVNWNLELPSPNSLMRQGWKKDDLKPGDTVTVTGHQARDNRTVARATVLTRSNGEIVFGRSDEPIGVN